VLVVSFILRAALGSTLVPILSRLFTILTCGMCGGRSSGSRASEYIEEKNPPYTGQHTTPEGQPILTWRFMARSGGSRSCTRAASVTAFA
jgi:hypothetical protein